LLVLLIPILGIQTVTSNTTLIFVGTNYMITDVDIEKVFTVLTFEIITVNSGYINKLPLKISIICVFMEFGEIIEIFYFIFSPNIYIHTPAL